MPLIVVTRRAIQELSLLANHLLFLFAVSRAAEKKCSACTMIAALVARGVSNYLWPGNVYGCYESCQRQTVTTRGKLAILNPTSLYKQSSSLTETSQV